MNSSLSCVTLDTNGLLQRRVMLAMIKATGRLREKSTVLTFSSGAVPIRINNPDYTSINQQVGGLLWPRAGSAGSARINLAASGGDGC